MTFKSAPVSKQILLILVAHALVAIGHDTETGEILFFDPQEGEVLTESAVLDRYNEIWDSVFNSLDELLAAQNFANVNNAVVEKEDVENIDQEYEPSPGGGSFGKNGDIYYY